MTEAGVLYDVNALLALSLASHVHHRAAHAHLATQMHWATTAMTEAGLVRLLLNPTITGEQQRIGDIEAVLRGMRNDPRWGSLPDDTSLTEALVDIRILMGCRQVTDLHLVNLAARHGVQLATFDRALLTWLAPADRHHVQLISATASDV